MKFGEERIIRILHKNGPSSVIMIKWALEMNPEGWWEKVRSPSSKAVLKVLDRLERKGIVSYVDLVRTSRPGVRVYHLVTDAHGQLEVRCSRNDVREWNE
jgi:DNA-binding PadR family transcriptional regulator